MQRTKSSEIRVALGAVVVLAFVIAFGIILTLSTPETNEDMQLTFSATTGTVNTEASKTPEQPTASKLQSFDTEAPPPTLVSVAITGTTADTETTEVTATPGPQITILPSITIIVTMTNTPFATDLRVEQAVTTATKKSINEVPQVTATFTATVTANLMPTVTATFTSEPTGTPTSTPTNTATRTTTLTSTASVTPTNLPSETPTDTPTKTEMPTSTNTSTPIPTATNTASRTSTATQTSTPTASVTPSLTISPTATATPTPQPTETSDLLPTSSPTLATAQVVASKCEIPEGWVPYEIRPGNTLFSIARAVGATINELGKANCLADLDRILAGEELYVPSGVAESESPIRSGTGGGTVDYPVKFDCENPGVNITSPIPGQYVGSTLTVIGTANWATLDYYKLEIRADGQDVYNFLYWSFTPVVDGTLGLIDFSSFYSGKYWIRLVVVDLSGNIPSGATCEIPVIVG